MTASLICEAFPELTGRQEPHHLSAFHGDTSLGAKAIELKRRVGVESMPWQISAQHAIMATTPAGKWTHPTCCLLCTRQNGKSEILIDRCLYGLFKLGETILYTAQRWKTARDAWKRMMSLIKRRKWLRDHVVRTTCSQGEGIIELDNGALISFGTRSNDSGRGLTVVDLIIYDEAYNLTDGEIAAMAFTQLAARNPQRIYASSAVNQDQHPNGNVLAAVRRRGLNGEERLYFAEFMAPDDPECCELCAAALAAGEMSRDDESTWQYANPSYGVIQTDEKIGDIKADLATEAGRKAFDVEALGRGDWPKWEEELAKVVEPEVWAARLDREPALAGSRVLGISLAPDRKHWAVAAGQRTLDGRIHVEVGMWKAATHAEVLRFLAACVTDWDPAAVVMDSKSLATGIVVKLAALGIDTEQLNTPAMADACGTFKDDIEAGTVSHSGQAELDHAADKVQKRELPQGDFVFACDEESAPFVAAAIAHQGVLRFASMPEEKPASPSSALDSMDPAATEGLDLLSVAF